MAVDPSRNWQSGNEIEKMVTVKKDIDNFMQRTGCY